MDVVNKNLSKRALEDYAFVRQALDHGTQKAYTELMNRYQNSIYHMMLKMANSPEDAHDLTQEAFEKAFSKLSSYEPRYAFSTWLFKIASNNAIDYIRKKRLHLLSIDEPIEGEAGDSYSNNLKSGALDPEERFIQKQRRGLMRAVLKKLDTKYRLMIELRFFEELSYDEIAKELDLPLGTVKAQLFRAKELLYNILQNPNTEAYIDLKRKK